VKRPDLPEILQGVPRWALLLAVPIGAFFIATAVAFGIGGNGGGDDSAAPLAPQRLTVQNLDVPATPTSQPTAVPAPNRKDCGQINGTAYKSPEEREWYVANCLNQTASTGGGGGGGGNTSPAAATGTGPATGAEFALGDRLVIPSISVNATVNGATVGPEGAMPDPKGYFNAVWYDFKYHGGIGGYTDGNLVLAAHVDCARCHEGGTSGLALFYYVKNLAAGADIQYFSHDGSVHNYRVRSVASYAPGADWGAILSTGAADMTLITCGGTWDAAAHEYSIRWAVYADEV
jgi:hypothetical protein